MKETQDTLRNDINEKNQVISENKTTIGMTMQELRETKESLERL